jgi:hypothetical protein
MITQTASSAEAIFPFFARSGVNEDNIWWILSWAIFPFPKGCYLLKNPHLFPQKQLMERHAE